MSRIPKLMKILTMQKMEEIWRDIPGYEGLYQVSNMGRVKGLPRKVNNATGSIQLKERFLKGHPITKGYIQVQLASKPRKVLRLVHVLVARLFVKNPHPERFNQVNHINGVKSDNRAVNLEWTDNSGNQKHAWRIGLQKVSGKAGKSKRKIDLIKTSDGSILHFECIADAWRFLGGKKHTKVNLTKALSEKYPHYKTIYGYKPIYV